MAEIINSSFIPKKEFKNERGPKKGLQLNVFFLISLVVFLSTIILSIGVYLWKIDLEKKNKQSREDFASRVEDYGVDSIENLSELSSRIQAAKGLLHGHYNMLPVLTYLEKNTLIDVQLTEFSLVDKEDVVFVSSRGRAPDLTDLQLQSRAYANNPNVEDLILSNITKSQEGYSVFDLEFSVDKKYLTHQNFVINNN